jgi:hypothetical protein
MTIAFTVNLLHKDSAIMHLTSGYSNRETFYRSTASMFA